MRAAVFYGPKRKLVIEDLPVPEIDEGEILVEVAACGICRSDLDYIDFEVPTFKAPPMVLGHEATGRVKKIGTEVKKFKIGDHVVIGNLITCGKCPNCLKGRDNACELVKMLGNNQDGAYAEFVKVPVRNVYHLPSEIPLLQGSVIADSLSTPFHAIKNRARVESGDKVAIFGCGAIGINAIQIANLLGAKVIAIDLGRGLPLGKKAEKGERKLDVARRMGAIATIDRTEPNLVKRIKELTNGGVDVSIEATGTPENLHLAYESLRPGGRLVVIGYPLSHTTFHLGRLMYRELEILGSAGCRASDMERLIELVAEGKIDTHPLVTATFPLEEINEAFSFVREGSSLKTVIVPTKEIN